MLHVVEAKFYNEDGEMVTGRAVYKKPVGHVDEALLIPAGDPTPDGYYDVLPTEYQTACDIAAMLRHGRDDERTEFNVVPVSDTKFTPGPFGTELDSFDDALHVYPLTCDGEKPNSCRYTAVATFHNVSDDDAGIAVQKANAILYTASPEMFALLESFAGPVDGQYDIGRYIREWQSLRSRIVEEASGKVLFHKDQSRVTLEMRYSDTVYTPCVIVKAFGCPTCGSENGRSVTIVYEKRMEHYEPYVIYEGLGDVGKTEEAPYAEWTATESFGRGTSCSDCGTVYSGRRRK